jgi:hypothetical protein
MTRNKQGKLQMRRAFWKEMKSMKGTKRHTPDKRRCEKLLRYNTKWIKNNSQLRVYTSKRIKENWSERKGWKARLEGWQRSKL